MKEEQTYESSCKRRTWHKKHGQKHKHGDISTAFKEIVSMALDMCDYLITI